MRKLRSVSRLRAAADQNRVRFTYPDNYSYDLDSNRVLKTHDQGNDGTIDDTTTSTYNADNELTQTVDSVNGTTAFGYDNNGSETSSTIGGSGPVYTYDVRNRLASVTAGGVTTTYGYDTAGNRVSETTGGTTTYYLIDANNPTGYPQPVEVRVGSPTGTPSMSYMIGLAVLGQADSSGNVSFFLPDGQGSTRGLVNTSGTVTATFDYDAFGNAIGFNPAAAPTMFLYGGDGMFDAPSGLYFHGSGRPSDNANDRFIEADPPGYANSADPITQNLYLLDNANAVNVADPSGHFSLVGLSVSMGISGLLSSIMTGAYGYAQGWSGQQIAKASAWSFAAGLAGGAIGAGVFAGAGAIAVAGGASAFAGQAAATIILSGITLPFAIVNVANAQMHGNATDKVFAWGGLGLIAVSDILGQVAGSGAFPGGATVGVTNEAGEIQLVRVTSWADKGVTPDLSSGRWVMLGGPTRLNYAKTGLWGPKVTFSPDWPYVIVQGSNGDFTNKISLEIPQEMIQWPASKWESWKGLLGQRQIK